MDEVMMNRRKFLEWAGFISLLFMSDCLNKPPRKVMNRTVKIRGNVSIKPIDDAQLVLRTANLKTVITPNPTFAKVEITKGGIQLCGKTLYLNQTISCESFDVTLENVTSDWDGIFASFRVEETR